MAVQPAPGDVVGRPEPGPPPRPFQLQGATSAFEVDEAPKRSKSGLIAAVVVVLALVSGGAGYAWWSGLVGNRPAQVALSLSGELAAAGLDAVKVRLGADWVAHLEGIVPTAAQRDRAVAIAEAHGGIKKVDNQLEVRDVPAEQLAMARGALAAAGFAALTLDANPDGSFVLRGDADDAAAADTATRAIMNAVTGARVRNETGRSVIWQLRDVRTALAAAGLGSVQANMIDKGAVVLEGQTDSEDQRSLAGNVAKVEGIASVVNNLSIREIVTAPMSAPVSQPPAPRDRAPPAAANRLEAARPQTGVPRSFFGEWGGRGALNGFSHVIYLAISGGEVGRVVGTGAYGLFSPSRPGEIKVACRTDLVLVSVERDLITLEEQLTSGGGFTCAGNKIIQLRAGNGSVNGQWLRKRDNSVAIRAPLYPNMVINGQKLQYRGGDQP